MLRQYFKKFYTKPYDNLTSLTLDHCHYIIRYENIKTDYIKALQKANVLNPSPLPVANKTAGKKRDILLYYTDEVKERAIYIFGPFLEKYNYSFPEKWGKVIIPIKSKIYFIILGFLRKINQKYFKKHPKNIGLKGSIYGDIQRKKPTN